MEDHPIHIQLPSRVRGNPIGHSGRSARVLWLCLLGEGPSVGPFLEKHENRKYQDHKITMTFLCGGEKQFVTSCPFAKCKGVY